MELYLFISVGHAAYIATHSCTCFIYFHWSSNGATRLYTCTISASPSSQLLPVPSICFRLVYPCLGDRSCFVPARPSSRSRRHNCVRTAEQWQDRHTPRWASSQHK
ncbi:hypothetical protein PVAP13_6KG319406 [Panicum virgatum]|uniref:Uncharacterized protein n=1 Tax=Panicum virgatum TaxID=38727 RepID=A0A8T0RHQ0_PANVG|nr:hypothetical protein PVAP13_6KG319406 [Panicum virgatum]